MVAKAVGTVIDPQIQKAALPSTLLHNHFADTKTTAINHVPVRRERRPVSLCFFFQPVYPFTQPRALVLIIGLLRRSGFESAPEGSRHRPIICASH